MIQDTLAEPEWADALGDADRRGLTPLSAYSFECSTEYGDICTSSGDLSGLFDGLEPVAGVTQECLRTYDAG